MVINDVFAAAYAKVNGFEVGKVGFNKEERTPEVEILGDKNNIQDCLKEYESGATISANVFAKEVSFLKYLVTKRAR